MGLSAAGTLGGAFRPATARYTAVEFAADAVFVANETLRQVQEPDAATGDPVAGFTPIGYSGTVGLLRAANGATLANLPLLPNAGGNISGIELDPASNSLFVFGNFSSLNGAAASRLARLDATTLALDASFVVTLPVPPFAVHADGIGGLWLAGGFNTVNGQPCVAPARVLVAGNGALDPAFSCVRTPLGPGELTFAGDALYAVQSSTIRRYRRIDGGASDPDWLVTALQTGSYGLRGRGAGLFVIGSCTQLSGMQRRSIATLPLVERLFANGFE